MCSRGSCVVSSRRTVAKSLLLCVGHRAGGTKFVLPRPLAVSGPSSPCGSPDRRSKCVVGSSTATVRRRQFPLDVRCRQRPCPLTSGCCGLVLAKAVPLTILKSSSTRTGGAGRRMPRMSPSLMIAMVLCCVRRTHTPSASTPTAWGQCSDWGRRNGRDKRPCAAVWLTSRGRTSSVGHAPQGLVVGCSCSTTAGRATCTPRRTGTRARGTSRCQPRSSPTGGPQRFPSEPFSPTYPCSIWMGNVPRTGDWGRGFGLSGCRSPTSSSTPGELSLRSGAWWRSNRGERSEGFGLVRTPPRSPPGTQRWSNRKKCSSTSSSRQVSLRSTKVGSRTLLTAVLSRLELAPSGLCGRRDLLPCGPVQGVRADTTGAH